MTRASCSQGFVQVLVLFGVFALAMGAAGLSVIVNDANNRHTAENLVSPLQEDYEEVTDQDIEEVRTNLQTNLNLGVLGASLGAPAGPSGSNSATVVVTAVRDGALSYAIPRSWTRCRIPTAAPTPSASCPRPRKAPDPPAG